MSYREMTRDLKPANVTWWDVELAAEAREYAEREAARLAAPCQGFGCFGLRSVAECNAAFVGQGHHR